MIVNTTASAAVVPATSSATLLVIDDDPAMRTILGFTLKAFGYVALVAGDGEEALQIARNHPEVSLVMLDVVMPGLSGKELADQLKIQLPESAVLFCSGHPAVEMSRYGIDLESAHFLPKPCRSPELQRKIEELLSTR